MAFEVVCQRCGMNLRFDIHSSQTVKVWPCENCLTEQDSVDSGDATAIKGIRAGTVHAITESHEKDDKDLSEFTTRLNQSRQRDDKSPRERSSTKSDFGKV